MPSDPLTATTAPVRSEHWFRGMTPSTDQTTHGTQTVAITVSNPNAPVMLVLIPTLDSQLAPVGRVKTTVTRSSAGDLVSGHFYTRDAIAAILDWMYGWQCHI